MHTGGFVNNAYRDLRKWHLYRDNVARSLFEHLLKIVNEDDSLEHGLCIKAGSVLTTIPEIKNEIGFTEKQLRFALKKLVQYHDISVSTLHSKGTIITLEEWHKYQFRIDDNSTNVTRMSLECHSKDVCNEDVINKNKTRMSLECHSNTVSDTKEACDVTRMSLECQKQSADYQEYTHKTRTRMSLDCHSNAIPKEQENETEKKEDTPIPTEEIKEKDKEKESVIQEEKNNIQKEETKEYPFEAFWDAYGKKIDRPKCERKWASLSKEDKKACMEYIPKYVAATPDIQFRRHPTTFLNNRSWENDLPSQQTFLSFGQQMSYGDRKRLLNGPELGHMPGTGEIINTDEINKEGPF